MLQGTPYISYLSHSAARLREGFASYPNPLLVPEVISLRLRFGGDKRATQETPAAFLPSSNLRTSGESSLAWAVLTLKLWTHTELQLWCYTAHMSRLHDEAAAVIRINWLWEKKRGKSSLETLYSFQCNIDSVFWHIFPPIANALILRGIELKHIL